MRRTQKLKIVTGSFVTVCIALTSACAQDTLTQNKSIELESIPFETLRSDWLKPAAKKQAPYLTDRTTRMLMHTLKNSVYTNVKTDAAKSLYEIAEPGNLALTQAVFYLLENTVNRLITGGSEQQINFAQYRYSLARLLEKLTGETLIGNHRDDRLTEREVVEVVNTVKQWLNEKEELQWLRETERPAEKIY